jgi:hypothetical protein
LYSFFSWALYLYWIAPIYGVYRLVNLIGPYICPKMFGKHVEEGVEENENKGKSKT